MMDSCITEDEFLLIDERLTSTNSEMYITEEEFLEKESFAKENVRNDFEQENGTSLDLSSSLKDEQWNMENTDDHSFGLEMSNNPFKSLLTGKMMDIEGAFPEDQLGTSLHKSKSSRKIIVLGAKAIETEQDKDNKEIEEKEEEVDSEEDVIAGNKKGTSTDGTNLDRSIMLPNDEDVDADPLDISEDEEEAYDNDVRAENFEGDEELGCNKSSKFAGHKKGKKNHGTSLDKRKSSRKNVVLQARAIETEPDKDKKEKKEKDDEVDCDKGDIAGTSSHGTSLDRSNLIWKSDEYYVSPTTFNKEGRKEVHEEDEEHDVL